MSIKLVLQLGGAFADKPKSGFHTDASKGANFEVDLDSSGKNKAFDADYKWKVNGNKITVDKLPVADLGDAGVESVVSFYVDPDP